MKKLLLASICVLSLLTPAFAEPGDNAGPPNTAHQAPPFLLQLFIILGQSPDTPCYMLRSVPSLIQHGEKTPALVCEIPQLKDTGKEAIPQPPETSPPDSNTPQKDPKPKSDDNSDTPKPGKYI